MELPGVSALEKIRNMKPAAFYVIHGEYEFLNKELAVGIAKVLYPDEAERANGTQRFDWSEGETAMAAWSEAVCTPSLFGGGQLLIVDNAHSHALARKEDVPSSAKEAEKFTNWDSYRRFERAVESPLDEVTTIFLCHEEMKSTTALKGRRSDKFVQRVYPLLNERGVIAAFPKMWDNRIAEWATARARATGIRMSTETAEFFIAWAGTDLRHLANELDKLATYIGEGGEIDEKIVRQLTTSSDDQFVYQIFDAAMDGDGNEALRLLDLSLKGAGQPLYITATLGSSMRDMWQARSLLDRGCFKKLGERYNRERAIAEMGSVPVAAREAVCAAGKASVLSGAPIKFFHAVRRARRLPMSTIEGIMQRLLDIDCRFKGIRRPMPGTEESILQQLMADIAYVAKKQAKPAARRSRY